MRITIVDYGLGNLWSVKNAFEFLNAEVTISSDPKEILASGALVLPGVGNFNGGMQNLRTRGLIEVLNEAVFAKKAPILGICLGMQLFADFSEEAPGVHGLGWIPGQVIKMKGQGQRLPHMGFNAAFAPARRPDVFTHVFDESQDFYFVHSYHYQPSLVEHVLARSAYGSEFVSAVKKDNIIGVQFHPEKSQSNGLTFIADFLRFCERKNCG